MRNRLARWVSRLRRRGLVANITGIDPSNATAIASELSWIHRTAPTSAIADAARAVSDAARNASGQVSATAQAMEPPCPGDTDRGNLHY